MNSAEMFRNKIRAAYVSEGWQRKVDDMSDNQVVAIYFRLKRQGRVV